MIEETLSAMLSDLPDLTALVDTRIYPLRAPQNVTNPYIVYSRVSGERIRSLSGPSGLARPRFQFNCYGSTYASARAVADALRKGIDGFRGYVGAMRIGGITVENDLDIYDEELKFDGVVVDALIWHDEET